MGRVPAKQEWPPESDRFIHHCDASPRPKASTAVVRGSWEAVKEGGGSREGVAAACLGLAVCVCVCAPACVRAGVLTARQHAALWKLGWEQGGLQRDATTTAPGADRPWEGWLWDGDQTARPRLRGPLSARPRGPPPGPGEQAAGLPATLPADATVAAAAPAQPAETGLVSLQPSQASGPLQTLPQGEYPAPTQPCSPSPTALACPQGLPGASCSRGPPVFLKPHRLPLSAPQQLCAPRTCPSCGRARVPPGSPPRTA